MKKVLFICKNVDLMSNEEISLTARLNRSGFDIRNYETQLENGLDLEISKYDLIIISNNKKNGFPPKIRTNKKEKGGDELFFQI